MTVMDRKELPWHSERSHPVSLLRAWQGAEPDRDTALAASGPAELIDRN